MAITGRTLRIYPAPGGHRDGGGAPLRVQVSRGECRSWWALDRMRSEGSENVDIFLLLSFDQDHVDESSL